MKPRTIDDAEKQRLEVEARKSLCISRLKLTNYEKPVEGEKALYDQGALVFFGALAMRLDVGPDWSMPTAAVDGRTLFYNPSFWMGLSADHRIGVVCHEVMHCALQHFARLQGRDRTKFNVASDLAINPMVLQSGIRLPDWVLLPGKAPYKAFPVGLSAEEYYELLQKEEESDGGTGDEGEEEGEESASGVGAGDGDADPGRCGGILPLPGSEPKEEVEANWREAVKEAAEIATKKAGSLPGALRRFVDRVTAPLVDWKRELREFVTLYARNDYSWLVPNRRFLSSGLYLPGMRSEELGSIVVCVDTSGSINQAQLDRFAAELEGILGAYDCQLRILYHDTRVAHEQEWKSSDGPLKLEAKGGGGTSHVEVLDRADNECPTAILCFTDCYTFYPSSPPTAPLMWCVVNNEKPIVPWGRVLIVKEPS